MSFLFSMIAQDFGLSSEARARIRIALATAIINVRSKRARNARSLEGLGTGTSTTEESCFVLPLAPPPPPHYRLDPRQLGCADEHAASTLSNLAHLALSFRCGGAVAPAELRASRSHLAALVKRLLSLEPATRAGKCSGPVARFAGIVTSQGLEQGPRACAGVAETLEFLAAAADGQWAPQVFLGAALVTKLPANDPTAVAHSLPVLLGALSAAAIHALPTGSAAALARAPPDDDLEREPPPAKQPRSSVPDNGSSTSAAAPAPSRAWATDELAAAAWRRMTAAVADLDHALGAFRPARFALLRLAADLDTRRPAIHGMEIEE